MRRSPQDLTRDVRGHFLQAVGHAARTAPHRHTGDPDDQWLAAISLGVSVEYLAKAYLAAINPLLVLHGSVPALTEPAHPATVLAVSAARAEIPVEVDHDQAVQNGLYTLNGPEACLLAQQLGCPLPYQPAVHDLVFDVRNQAIHSAAVHTPTLHRAIPLAVELLEPLRTALAVPAGAFWGQEHPLSTADS